MLSIFLNAQEINFPPGTKFTKIDFEKKEIDEANTNVFYNYTFLKNIKTSKLSETLTILSIGNNYTKFYDYNKFLYEKYLDSINKIKSNHEANDAIRLISLMRKINFKPSILGEKKENSLYFIVQDNIYTDKFQYNYGDYKLNWNLTSNEKKIGEYLCKEATLNFGGRKWTAYYTEEIPLNFGPYIFNGLPGLILEIYDTKKEHHFLFEAINSNKMSIYIDNIYSNKQISKKDFFKGIKNFHDNPGQFIGKSYSSQNVEEELKPLPYNPIELE